MPIFDQGYQHWQGKLSGHALRWLAIARQGVRAQMKNRWARMITLFALVPALVLAGFLILWGLIEQKSNLVAGLLPLFQDILPPEALGGPKAYRITIWTIAYQYFFNIQMTFAMILVLLVGPGLISQDLRFNAIPLYFSRPLRRFDYFLGKLAVIGFFLGMVAVVPVLIAYVLGISFSLDPSVAWETARIMGAALLYGLLIVVSAGTLMLAISSLSRNSRYVSVAWFGFWLITNGAAGILVETVQSDWCHLVSYTGNLQRVGGALLGTASAWEQFNKLLEDRRTPGPGAFPPPGGHPMQGGMPAEQHPMPAPPGGRPTPRGPDGEPIAVPIIPDSPPPGPGGRRPGATMRAPGAPEAGPPMAARPGRPPAPPQQPPPPPRRARRREVGMAGPDYPWYWSAGVLAGLFGLSVCILSSRVKTMDRLR